MRTIPIIKLDPHPFSPKADPLYYRADQLLWRDGITKVYQSYGFSEDPEYYWNGDYRIEVKQGLIGNSYHYTGYIHLRYRTIYDRQQKRRRRVKRYEVHLSVGVPDICQGKVSVSRSVKHEGLAFLLYSEISKYEASERFFKEVWKDMIEARRYTEVFQLMPDYSMLYLMRSYSTRTHQIISQLQNHASSGTFILRRSADSHFRGDDGISYSSVTIDRGHSSHASVDAGLIEQIEGILLMYTHPIRMYGELQRQRRIVQFLK